jgi:type IV pilus assembly protein PilC
LQVSSVEELGKRPGFLRVKSRLAWHDLDLFNQQLLAIVKSGLPLAQSLRAVAAEIKNRRLRRIFDDVRSQIEAGGSLEDAIANHPESFSPVYSTMIRAGERTGNLSGVLSHLCAYSGRMVEIKNGIQEAIAYPILVLVACAAVLGFLLIRVVPVFAGIYKDFGGDLPGPTQLCVAISDFFVTNWPALGIWAAVVLLLARLIPRVLSHSEPGAHGLDWLKLHVPIFGVLYFRVSVARFCRSLGLLLSSKVPVLEALDLASAGAGNAVLRRAVNDAARLVEGGERVSDALASTGYFGHSLCWMLSTAEDRGDVHEALLELADMYERGAMRIDKLILTLAGPAIVVLVGLMIGYLVISLYLPIFMLGDAISGL